MKKDQRFPREERLSASKEVRWLIKNGKKYVGSILILYAHTSPGPQSRAGFIVSKRVGPAVVRNRFKRWMRESFRRQKSVFGDGMDLIFIARSRAHVRTGYAEVFEELTRFALKITDPAK